jgi:hypothetical protein
MTVATKLRVTVHYPPAEEPFKDHDADPGETVGHLKARVLEAFGLTEGQLPDGTIATYTLFHGKAPLENMNQTLGDIAGDKKELQLKLSQQLTQGRWQTSCRN